MLRADPLLRARYRELYLHRLRQWEEHAHALVAPRLVRAPRPPATLHELTSAVRLVAENWVSFLDVVGDTEDPAEVARVGWPVLAVLDPYLTARGRRQWREGSSQHDTRDL